RLEAARMSTFTIDTSTSRATPSPVPGKRTTAPSIRARKLPDGNVYRTEQPIVMLTAYTMRMAQLLDPHCDMLLVGDSLGQVIYGLPSTIPVTMEMMCAHGGDVGRRRGNGANDQIPCRARRAGDRARRPHPPGGQRAGRLWSPRARGAG